MTPKQKELYQRIKAYSLDEPNAIFPFSKRLGKENQWTAKYTYRVIEEYKKFAFLAVVAGHPVSPSEQVDKVWHLHLIYTQNYWNNFCTKILEFPFHHQPSYGGKQENNKFHDWYHKTLDSYKIFFDNDPPVDIWPPPNLRFSNNISLMRKYKNYQIFLLWMIIGMFIIWLSLSHGTYFNSSGG